MIRRIVLAAALVGVPLVPAGAQQAAGATGTTRCGGVLCDLYYANKPAPAPGQPDVPDPTHLPCRDFICAAFGGRTPEPAPPPVEAAVAPTEQAAPPAKKHKTRAHKTVAAADAAAPR